MATTIANNFEGLQLDEVIVSKAGAKRAQLRTADGKDVIFQPPCLLNAPFGPSSFDKDPEARRQALEIRTWEGDPEGPLLEQYFRELDAWALQYLSAHSERLLKKKLSPEQVAVGYTSALKEKEGYRPLLRVKIDTSGPREVCYWTPEGEPAEAPGSWRQASLRGRLHISNLWVMGGNYGLVVNCTDIQVVDEDGRGSAAQPRVCPFA